MAEFPDILDKAGKQHRPSVISKYLFELAHAFNNYYQKEKII